MILVWLAILSILSISSSVKNDNYGFNFQFEFPTFKWQLLNGQSYKI